MNVTLTNFRCHRHQTFTFASGLNLIEGKSGQGKTTILDAISWCLLGKQRNVLTRGEKKCSVMLNLSTPQGLLSLTRTKLPSRLVISLPDGRMLEDDAAQEYVYQLIGGENFELTSYMLQKGTTQFFTLPAAEKRKFIESLSKQHNNLEQVKERVQTRIKELKANLAKHQTLLDYTRASKPMQAKEVDLLGLEYACDLELSERLLQKTEEEYTRQHAVLKGILAEYLREMSNRKKAESEKVELESVIKMLTSQLENTSSRLSTLDYSSLSHVEQQLLLGQQHTEHQKKKAELLQAKKNYEDVVKQEEAALRERIEQLESQLQPESSLQENPELKKRYQDLLKHRDLTSRLPAEVNLDSQKELVSRLKEIQQRKTVVGCPHCSKGLVLRVNAVAKADGKPLTEEEKKLVGSLPEEEKKLLLLEKKSAVREQILQELSEIQLSPQAEEEYNREREQLQQSKTVREKNAFIRSQLESLKKTTAKDKFLSLRKQYEKELEVFKSMPKGEAIENLEQLALQVKELSRVKMEAENLERELSRLNQKILATQQSLSRLPAMKESVSAEEVERVQQKSREMEEKLLGLKQMREKLTKVEEYAKRRREYKNWEQSVKKQAELVEITGQELVSLETFLRKITEAETKCLEETIRVLNRKVQEYLDKFFPDDPIRMELATEKESKKSVKTEIALKVLYKSEECDLSSLSGGEYDRCALAFLLAVNEVCSSPLLILDESIGSLDMTNAENVLEVLKETVQEKVVILVQHQATCGSYDHVVRV